MFNGMMKPKPKITFVMPTRNRIAWLGETVQGYLAQTEKEIELLIVNDASTDGTKEFLANWLMNDKRVTVIHNPESRGAGISRNIGMKAAKADIIGVCDDDDLVDTDRAKVTLKWFVEHPESELVNFPYVRIDYFNNFMEKFDGQVFNEKVFKETGQVNYFSNPTAAYKKRSGLEMGGYPAETEGMTDDYQFIRNWIKAGKKVDFSNEAYVIMHRVLPDSIMQKQRGWNPSWATNGVS